ncbi:ATP synthase F1 subunit epsilon [Terriglobus tenax]|uniref:ATP synthase F1 subunit epsilon n=1 Tax=Terriglobus tenax TaxID=1111115 RepID=UPI0021DF6D63|nr:ATP synthase F1 subunit epsilon [Terriglobus tenax]
MAETTNNSGLLTVRLVTPQRVVIDTTAEAVELPSMSGYLEALYGASPLLAELGAGEVRLHGGASGNETFFVAWGFAEVLPERVTILAEQAMKPAEINVEKAKADLAKGEKDWADAGDDANAYDEANAEIRVAEEKLNSAQGKSH